MTGDPPCGSFDRGLRHRSYLWTGVSPVETTGRTDCAAQPPIRARSALGFCGFSGGRTQWHVPSPWIARTTWVRISGGGVMKRGKFLALVIPLVASGCLGFSGGHYPPDGVRTYGSGRRDLGERHRQFMERSRDRRRRREEQRRRREKRARDRRRRRLKRARDRRRRGTLL